MIYSSHRSVPDSLRHLRTAPAYTLGVLFSGAIAAVACYYSFQTLWSNSVFSFGIMLPGGNGEAVFTADDFSSIFSLTAVAALIPVLWEHIKLRKTMDAGAGILGNVFLPLFVLGTLAVITAGTVSAFLLAWELMSISSFLMMVVSAQSKATIKAAVNYVAQMHLAFFVLAAGLFIASGYTGTFEIEQALTRTFEAGGTLSYAVLSLIFIGLGFKMGLFGLHTWLPKVYEHAPGTVTALMTGFAKTAAVYFFIRWVSYIPAVDFYGLACLLIAWGVVTAGYGALKSAVSARFSHLLAYSTMENMGLIVLAAGLGLLGASRGPESLKVVAFGAAVFHAVNHAFFKPALILVMNRVRIHTGTDNINFLGGLQWVLPAVAVVAVVAGASASGLPPFSGFFSKFLIFRALFEGFAVGRPEVLVPALAALIGLAFVSGLTLFAFAKAVGLVFSGYARRAYTPAYSGLAFPWPIVSYLPVLCGTAVVATGFYRFFGLSLSGTLNLEKASLIIQDESFQKVVWFSGIPVALFCLLYFLKYRQSKTVEINRGPVWGCGYEGKDAGLQYTGSTFSDLLSSMTPKMSGVHLNSPKINEMDLFPTVPAVIARPEEDPTETRFIDKLLKLLPVLEKKVARIQTGDTRDYLLYGLIFILLLFILVFTVY